MLYCPSISNPKHKNLGTVQDFLLEDCNPSVPKFLVPGNEKVQESEDCKNAVLSLIFFVFFILKVLYCP